MKLTALTVAVLSAGMLATGCVSQKKYKELQASHSKLQAAQNELAAKNQQCQTDLSGGRIRIQALDEALASERANVISLQNALDKCLTASSQGSVNIAKLVDEINASNKYIQHLINLKNKSDSLNMVLTNNLTRSLSSAELQDVDVKVQKGVVYISLSDNMLYKSGSYEISNAADATLGKIAKIIMDHNEFDVLIEGNTDNVPINKPNIRNNWDLSALRASSVVQSLQNKYGVDPKRMTAGGRGEYNPIANNDSDTNKARNRRTQIIILPKLDQFMDLIEKGPEANKQ